MLDLQQIRENNGVLKRRRNPYQIQRILIDSHNLRQRRRVCVANIRARVRLDADPKVSDSDLHLCSTHDVCGSCHDTRVDLRGVEYRAVFRVVHRYEEYVWYLG